MTNNQIIIYLCVFTLLLNDNIFANFGQNKANFGTIYGEIKDQNGSAINNATINLESGGREIKLKINIDGKYIVRLQPGIYRAYVTADGFCPMTRSLFKVEENMSATIEYILFVCTIVHSFDVSKSGVIDGESDNLQYPFKSESLLLNGILNQTPNELFLQYGSKVDQGDQTVFTSLKDSGYNFNSVIATINLLTIYADTIVFNKNRKLVIASGNVTVNDGNHENYAAKVNLRFDKQKITYEFVR